MEKVINLGWAMARLNNYNKSIIIVSPADQIGEDFVPSSSIVISGYKDIKILKDALNELFPEE